MVIWLHRYKRYFAAGLMTALCAALRAEAKSPPCVCPDSIGADAGSPPLVVLNTRHGRPGLIACGHLESRRADNSVLASEFDIFQCGSGKPILTFDALRRCEIVAKRDRLVVTELTEWPFGPGWEWIDLPFREVVIVPGRPPKISEKFVLHPPSLTPQQIREVLAQFERQKSAKAPASHEENEDLIGRILVAALAGSNEARKALEHMNDALILDGASGEEYNCALKVYNAYAKETGRVPEALPFGR